MLWSLCTSSIDKIEAGKLSRLIGRSGRSRHALTNWLTESPVETRSAFKVEPSGGARERLGCLHSLSAIWRTTEVDATYCLDLYQPLPTSPHNAAPSTPTFPALKMTLMKLTEQLGFLQAQRGDARKFRQVATFYSNDEILHQCQVNNQSVTWMHLRSVYRTSITTLITPTQSANIFALNDVVTPQLPSIRRYTKCVTSYQKSE